MVTLAKKPAPAKAAPKAATKTAAKVAATPAPAVQPTAVVAAKPFMKPMVPSKELAAVVGATPLPRTQVTKSLWAYIKTNNLQDPKNKRMINADAKLQAIFGKAVVGMMELAGLTSKHLSPVK